MNKIKKTVATLGVTAALLVGGASAAQAYSTYKTSVYVGNYTYHVYVNVDYDWWEETFQGKRDYRYYSHYLYCPPGKFCVL